MCKFEQILVCFLGWKGFCEGAGVVSVVLVRYRTFDSFELDGVSGAIMHYYYRAH